MVITRVVFGLILGLALIAPGTVAIGSENGGDSGGGLSPVPTTLKEVRGDLAIWTVVVFLVLLAVLWKFAWGPIRSGLEKREKAIADQISQAEQSNVQAKQLLAEYEQKLADSKKEVRGILEQGRQDAEQLGRQMVEEARQEAQAEQQRALQQIDEATTAALKELADRSATLAVDLAGKIVGETLDRQGHSRLIERAVSDFAAGKPENN